MKFKAAIIGGLSALLVLTGVVAPASATHPTVQGIFICNTATGLYDGTWTVTSDPGYSAGGTFVSATRVSDQIVGKTVFGNGAAITPAPTESVATSARLSLKVGIQFTNHSRGDIVYNTGSATFNTPTCEIPLPESHEVPGAVVDGSYDCDDTSVSTTQEFTLYTYSRDVDGSVVETVTTRTVTGVRALTPEEIAAKDAAVECQPVVPEKPADIVTEGGISSLDCDGKVVSYQTWHDTVTHVLVDNVWVAQPSVRTIDTEGTTPATEEQCPPPVCPEGEEVSNGVCTPVDEPCPSEEVCPTPTPTPTPSDIPSNLPVAGTDSIPTALFALMLVLAGWIAVVFMRTYRRNHADRA